MSVEDHKAFKATIFTIMKRMEKREVIEPVDKRGTIIVWRLEDRTKAKRLGQG